MATRAQSPTPRVWVLLGRRAGDNAALLALADGLGWPYEAKRLAYRRSELATNLLFDATLLGRIGRRSDPLAPPWPDLVLSAGRRSEPVARWIRRQASPPPRLVHVGRPWRDPAAFDLVVVTPQYRVAPRGAVLRNELPLHGVTAERLARAAAEWQPRFADLPRPWTAVLIGGDSELFTIDARVATELAREASARVRASGGGSLLVTTSARTRACVAPALRHAIDVPLHLFTWSDGTADNPYWGYLALADAFVVTGDSVSMLAEACATGKPVHIFDPGRTRRSSFEDLRALRRRVLNGILPRLRRDLRRIHEELVRLGHAAFVGDSLPEGGRPAPSQVERTVDAVRALLGAPALPATERSAPRPADRADGS